MSNKTMGELISTLRKEKSMTQKDLAEKLNVTDKAVSKWERNLSSPDISIIPRLAELLGVSTDALLNAKTTQPAGHRGAGFLVDLILKAVPIAMGVALAVTSLLGELESTSGFTMAGIGIACLGISLLRNKS